MTDAPPRPDAPSRDQFTLTVEEVLLLYEQAGFPRPRRRIQKYCARGDLECLKVETQSAEKYLITPVSVDRHIALVKQTDAARRAPARPDAPERHLQQSQSSVENGDAPAGAPPRPDAPDFQARYMGQLETENEFLRGQNTVLLERIKETNVITAQLQRILAPLLGAPDRKDTNNEG